MLTESALLKAIGYCGKQKKLAELIGEDPDKISYWLNRGKRIPFHNAVAIEKATDGKVSRYDLAPYARVNRKTMNEYGLLQNYSTPMTISERVVIGLSIERSLGNRRGARSDLICDEKNHQPGSAWPQVKGKTTELAAKKAGFNSRHTYLLAKKVMTLGIFQLVEAMDKKSISIATAAALAELSPTEQESLLAKDKKEIWGLIQKKSHSPTSSNSTLAFSKHEGLKCAEQQYLMPFRLVLMSILLQCDALGYFPWQPEERDDLLAYVSSPQIDVIQEQLAKLGWIKKIQMDDKTIGQLNQMVINYGKNSYRKT